MTGAALFDADALGRFLASALLHVALGTGRLAWPVGIGRSTHELELAAALLGLDDIPPMRLALPALLVLDTGNGPVRGLDVEALVGLDNLEGVGVDAVDGQVQVQVVGVGRAGRR